MFKNKSKVILLSLVFIFIICLNVVSASNETDQLSVVENVDDDVVSSVEEVPLTHDSEQSDVLAYQNKTPKVVKTIIKVDSSFSRQATDYYAGERGGMFYATLDDENGNPLVNKTVQITVNGPIYDVTTDSQGRAGLQVNLVSANLYTYGLTFSGFTDDDGTIYDAAPIASSKLTVTKKTTSISASAKTFKKSAKTKSISVTLKTSKNPYDKKTYLKAGKKITLKVNGKTYTAKINSKGVAKFKIKLTKKGKYNAKFSFAGDKTYKKSSKSVKITIK